MDRENTCVCGHSREDHKHDRELKFQYCNQCAKEAGEWGFLDGQVCVQFLSVAENERNLITFKTLLPL